jgi:exopolysaccharide biosynthesis polyprenyl glycosylphosphotransferase
MYKKDTIRWFKHWDFMLLDTILLQMAYVLANIFRNGWNNLYSNLIHRYAAIFLFIMSLFIGVFAESYDGILRRGYWQEAKAVFRYVITVTVSIVLGMYVFKVSSEFSRIGLGLFPILAFVFLYIGRITLKRWMRNHRGAATGKRGIMLVTAQENCREVIDQFLANPYSEFHVVGAAVINTRSGQEWDYRGIHVIADEDKLLSYIQQEWVDEVLFSIPREYSIPQELIDKCRIMGLTIHMELIRMNEGFGSQIVETIEGCTVLSCSMTLVTPGQIFVKRFVDVLGSIVGLMITGVAFLFVAPMIYRKSPGPIFFKQVRMGRNGRKFNMYKFRSMYMDAEERKQELMKQNNVEDGLMFKMENDPRIIQGIGTFIRNYSIDELPQFWNVLKGDMSLIGTRPPTVDEWEKYEYHHRTRMAIKPGMTGMWQVSGRSDITDFEEVVRLDEEYIQKWNLGLDIKILLQTVLVVFRKSGSR